ncbi:MAG: hypothetical protein WC365_00200 [Candidatus Babeliales bacterium]|jgi:hypothetical protein
MKKHILIGACALLIFHHQTTFCMDQQPIHQESVAANPFKTCLLNKVTGIKSWITHHKKEILMGGMALAVVAAAAFYYYHTSQITPLHAQPIDAFNTVTPAPPSTATTFFNTIANETTTTMHHYTNPQCANPEKLLTPEELLAVADTCARIPDHCFVDAAYKVSTDSFPYSLNGKEYDYSLNGCSHQHLRRLHDGYQACYNSISKYAQEYGLAHLQDRIEAAVETAKKYWRDLEFYKGLKNTKLLNHKI